MATSNKKYEEYKKNKTREKNKARKLIKYVAKNPNDQQAADFLNKLQASI